MNARQDGSLLYSGLLRHSSSNQSLVTALLWGVAEAMLFFIVPDVYLGFVAMFHGRKGLLGTFAAVVGVMIGGTIIYGLAIDNGAAMARLLEFMPLISPEMVHSVTLQMQVKGLSAILDGPRQGIPYKVYAVEAGRHHLPFPWFLLITVTARIKRFLFVALLGAALGRGLKGFIQRHTTLVVGAYALIWLSVYVLYYLWIS